jgi:hypothetical protein
VFLSCVDIPEQPSRPSGIAAAPSCCKVLGDGSIAGHAGPTLYFARCEAHFDRDVRHRSPFARLIGPVDGKLRETPVGVCLLPHIADGLAGPGVGSISLPLLGAAEWG